MVKLWTDVLSPFLKPNPRLPVKAAAAAAVVAASAAVVAAAAVAAAVTRT
jgi:hypothetical protein